MINRAVLLVSCLTVAAALRGAPVSAQTYTNAIEVPIGWTAPVDESLINHFAIGVAGRLALTPRVSVGPEFFYFRGPRTDRDVMLSGQVWWALADERRPVVPFLTAGGGFMRTSIRGYASTGWAVNGGGGVRIAVTDRVYIAPDVRIGFEMFIRTTVAIGYRWTR